MNISPVSGAARVLPATDAKSSHGKDAVVALPVAAPAAAAPVEIVRPAARAAALAAELDRYTKESSRNLEFTVDDASGQVVVSVRNKQTGELIRQIPGETALRIARHLAEVDGARASLLIEEQA